jgi:hypothetical protein
VFEDSLKKLLIADEVTLATLLPDFKVRRANE